MLTASEASKRNRQVQLLQDKRLYEKLHAKTDENGKALIKDPSGPRSPLPMCKPADRKFSRPARCPKASVKAHNVRSALGREKSENKASKSFVPPNHDAHVKYNTERAARLELLRSAWTTE
jgi:hypothetical protein